MIITNDFIFIHFPKNGGSFVTECIKQLYSNNLSKLIKARYINRFVPPFIKEQINYYDLFRSETLEDTGKMVISKHQGCDEIPASHLHKPIFSTIRNPFDRYVSLYHYGWWKRRPVVDQQILFREFPNYPDLSFKEFLRLILDFSVEVIKTKNNFEVNIGPYTLYYIKLFYENYMEVLKEITSINDLNSYNEYNASFLKQSNLNKDLYNHLLKYGWAPNKIEFILNYNRINTSRNKYSYKEYYDKEDISLIKEREEFIFTKFPFYSFE